MGETLMTHEGLNRERVAAEERLLGPGEVGELALRFNRVIGASFAKGPGVHLPTVFGAAATILTSYLDALPPAIREREVESIVFSLRAFARAEASPGSAN
jgi:hypothetical protein